LRLSGAVLAFALSAATLSAEAQLYHVTDLGTLGGNTSSAFTISEDGEIVGNADTAGGNAHAFLYSGGVMNDLGTLGGTTSSAVGLDGAGEAVGQSWVTGNTAFHAFSYIGGMMTDLGTLTGGVYSSDSAMNASGTIVGTSERRRQHSRARLCLFRAG